MAALLRICAHRIIQHMIVMDHALTCSYNSTRCHKPNKHCKCHQITAITTLADAFIHRNRICVGNYSATKLSRDTCCIAELTEFDTSFLRGISRLHLSNAVSPPERKLPRVVEKSWKVYFALKTVFFIPLKMGLSFYDANFLFGESFVLDCFLNGSAELSFATMIFNVFNTFDLIVNDC